MEPGLGLRSGSTRDRSAMNCRLANGDRAQRGASRRPRSSCSSCVPARLLRCRSAGCSSAGRGVTRAPRRPARGRLLSGVPPTGSRRLSRGSSGRSRATCSSSSPSSRRGGRGTAGPGAGELVEWRPVLDRAGVRACPNRVAAVYLELAILLRALEGLTPRRQPRRAAGPLVALGGALRPPRHAPRLDGRRPPRARGVERGGRPAADHGRRLDQPRSRRALRAASARRRDRHGRDLLARAGREGGESGGRLRAAGRRGDADRRRGRGFLRPGGARRSSETSKVELDLETSAEPTGVALIYVDAARRDRDRRRSRRERDARRGGASRARRRALPARDPRRRRLLGVGGLHRASSASTRRRHDPSRSTPT